MSLTIWFDFANSPQVKFFAKIIKELKQEHKIVITCRPLANTIELLEIEGFDYNVIGRHYGIVKSMKILGIFDRSYKLYKFIRKQNIDVAASHSSFYLPIVCRLLNIKNIYINDNEFASWNKISIRLSTLSMFPEPLNEIAKQRKWDKIGKLLFYPGIKEGVYLWDYKKKKKSSDSRNIYFRTEPWNADYYKGKLNFIDEKLIELSKKYNVYILPRGQKPIDHYSQKKFKNLHLIRKSISQYEIFDACDLFIGAGGSMTREAATVGIPTISIYQGGLLSVDKFLISEGFMIHNQNLSIDDVDDLVKSFREPHVGLLNLGKKAHSFIADKIKSIANY